MKFNLKNISFHSIVVLSDSSFEQSNNYVFQRFSQFVLNTAHLLLQWTEWHKLLANNQCILLLISVLSNNQSFCSVVCWLTFFNVHHIIQNDGGFIFVFKAFYLTITLYFKPIFNVCYGNFVIRWFDDNDDILGWWWWGGEYKNTCSWII